MEVEDEDGEITLHDDQPAVENAIWDEVHRKRFHLAESAPICKGQLRGSFGHMATSPTAKAVLVGTSVYQDNFDEATKELLEECTRIRENIPEGSVSSLISKETWMKK